MASQPLRVKELAEVLAFDFDEAPGGIPTLNADWRREDQERAVLSTCSSLITVVHHGFSRVVQFSHFSVKEFLTSDRLAIAAEDISFYHIAPAPAHTILTQTCLGTLLRLDVTTQEASVQQFPLLSYALHHWVDHALFEDVLLRVQDGIGNLFDIEKPHFSRWIRFWSHLDDPFWRDDDETDLDQPEVAPMYYAAFFGFTQVIEKLITEHPEYVSAWGGTLGTALHAASRRNHLKIVQSLLRHGADVNAPGLWGWTPLLFATDEGHLEVVRWLLEHGAEVNAEDEDNLTSLHLAARYGHHEIGQALLKHNANTTARNNNGRTPLHLACGGGHIEIVRFLLNHGANPRARDIHLRTSLHHVSSKGNLDIARLLVEHGAEVDAEDKNGRTSYQFALTKGHDEVVRFLLAHGAERTART